MGDPFKSDPFKKNKTTIPIGGVTVMIRYNDGNVVSVKNISNPWPYIIKARQNPNVTSVWIDDKYNK
jgi:hypothetical protein